MAFLRCITFLRYLEFFSKSLCLSFIPAQHFVVFLCHLGRITNQLCKNENNTEFWSPQAKEPWSKEKVCLSFGNLCQTGKKCNIWDFSYIKSEFSGNIFFSTKCGIVPKRNPRMRDRQPDTKIIILPPQMSNVKSWRCQVYQLIMFLVLRTKFLEIGSRIVCQSRVTRIWPDVMEIWWLTLISSSKLRSSINVK